MLKVDVTVLLFTFKIVFLASIFCKAWQVFFILATLLNKVCPKHSFWYLKFVFTYSFSL